MKSVEGVGYCITDLHDGSSLIYQAELGYMEEVSDEISSFVGMLMMWSLLPTEIVFKHHLNAPCSLTD